MVKKLFLHERFAIGNIIRLVAPQPKPTVNMDKYIKIGETYFFANRIAIIIGYGKNCTFPLPKDYIDSVVALGSKGEVFIVRDIYTWRVVGHCEIGEFLSNTFKEA